MTEGVYDPAFDEYLEAIFDDDFRTMTPAQFDKKYGKGAYKEVLDDEAEAAAISEAYIKMFGPDDEPDPEPETDEERRERHHAEAEAWAR